MNHVVIFLSLAFCLFINGCGFQPLYLNHPKSDTHHTLTIKLKSSGYTAVKLQNMLEMRKGLIESKLNHDTTLIVITTEEFAPIGIASDGLTTRSQGRIAIDLSLTEKTIPQITKTAHFDHVSSYNMDDGDSFVYERTQNSVRLRLLEALSDQIVRETLYLLD
ncbi:MAG: hypothetical protein HEEMFOPI_00797 [Holosporales bacterium]